MPLGEDERKTIPFQIVLPWETPITMTGAALGVRAEAEIAGATVKGDLATMSVQPLLVQWRTLEAFGTLGWTLEDADIQFAKVPVSRPAPPVQQVFELRPANAVGVGAFELIFDVTSQNVEVLLGFGEQGFPGRYDRYTVAHAGAETVDWTGQVDGWVRQALEHRVTVSPLMGERDDDSGPGMGGAVTGAVGGLAAGYVASEVMGDLFDDDDDE
ncbi:sporulation protein [Paractinoplanes atraurantiacus]|uniref:Sporulation-control protein n=1 Tax=Paractinoplanes atraurantiacus TaxID=1036182 RepID=A0A285GPD6_9ACTN|nr:sporulation protein [Actinoplanes atraurantiacus]SNY25298.1 sporulation-control protein [Actinoplanes atraurantiacus]